MECEIIKELKRTIRDIEQYKYLLFTLIRRDLKGRYKNSIIGPLWFLITPLILIILFYIVFENVGVVPIDNYWYYLCVGIFPFYFLMSSIITNNGCLLEYTGMIKKIKFPIIIVVISKVTSSFIQMAISFVFILVIAAVSKVDLNIIQIGSTIVCSLLMYLFALGALLAFSSLVVFYRDVQHLINTLSISMYWITPVFYLYSNTSGVLRTIIDFNPLAYYVRWFQQELYYQSLTELHDILVCVILSVLSVITGYVIFLKTNNRFEEKL